MLQTVGTESGTISARQSQKNVVMSQEAVSILNGCIRACVV